MAKDTGQSGLTEQQARKNLAKYGRNELVSQKPKSPVYLFLSQFKDILILILAAATLFSVIAGQMTEAVTIISIMLLNAMMGFIQEYRTEKTIQSLKQMTAPVARVRREGALQTLDAALVAVGDVIELRTGDRIPADARLLAGAGLKTDESILSGESRQVEKKPGAAGLDLLFMGTSVVAGHGVAVVEKTGMRTEMGKIANLLSEVEEEPTPLQRKLASLGKFIAVSCLGCGGAVIALGIARGENPFDMVLTGISLAVAAIPEGLPAIVTIVLALSVNRILSRGAVIRRLHAVETLGSATVICTDKTGTITENRMLVTELYAGGERYALSGGATQSGRLTAAGKSVDLSMNETLKAALVVGVLCSTSSVEPDGAHALKGRGSPTEIALLGAAYKCGLTREKLAGRFHQLDELPFDSTRKMMSVYVKHGGRLSVMTKGAPDRVLEKCVNIGTQAGIRPITAADRAAIRAEVERMANDAQRVIALAIAEGDFKEEGLTFLALAGMKDPPRREVREAVRLCRRAGIRPVMITGDHALTARAVAREVGIMNSTQRVIEGEELDRMDDAQLRRTVETASVFARVSPTHKLRIVKALKQNGQIIAMAGDGVNDAPAIKTADIGVAMGISGSDVTKEASSVVILDDNFATIVAAVEEGRIIYQNIRRFIRFLLSSNLGEVLTVVLAMAFGMPVIFLPIQILLINLVTDGLPAVALGMEPAGDGIMCRPPRDPNETLFANGLGVTIVFRGLVLALCNLLSFASVYRLSGGDLVVARSAAFMTLILAQMIHVFECKLDRGAPLSSLHPLRNRTLLAACTLSVALSAAVVYLPPLQAIFQTAAVRGALLVPTLGSVLISPLVGLLDRAFTKPAQKPAKIDAGAA